MRRWMIIGGLVLVAGSAWFGLRASRVSLGDIIREPFVALWGSQHQLNSTLLDVSENGEPITAASRRLLQPFGKVRLIRVFPFKEERNPR